MRLSRKRSQRPNRNPLTLALSPRTKRTPISRIPIRKPRTLPPQISQPQSRPPQRTTTPSLKTSPSKLPKQHPGRPTIQLIPTQVNPNPPRRTPTPSLKTSPSKLPKQHPGRPTLQLIPTQVNPNPPRRTPTPSLKTSPSKPPRRPATTRHRLRSQTSHQASVQANRTLASETEKTDPTRWSIPHAPKKTPRWVAFT